MYGFVYQFFSFYFLKVQLESDGRTPDLNDINQEYELSRFYWVINSRSD